MGKAKISLKMLDSRTPTRVWLTLGDERFKKDVDFPRGQVEVVAWWHFDDRWKLDVPNDTEDDVVPDGPCNQLCVCVLRAWNVLALDYKTKAGSGGASDPFCIVRCNRQEKTTPTVDANVHPVWLSTFKFLADNTRDVTFEVWDYDSFFFKPGALFFSSRRRRDEPSPRGVGSAKTSSSASPRSRSATSSSARSGRGGAGST